MRRVPHDSETAISQVAGMTIFLFLAVVLSGCAYAWIRSVEPPMHSTHAVSFAHGSYGEEEEGVSKTLTVTIASLNTYWWNLEVRLDGKRLECSAEHGAEDSFRLWWQGKLEDCDGPRDMPDERVGAGQWIEIWDAGASAAHPLAGREMQILAVDENAIIQRVRI